MMSSSTPEKIKEVLHQALANIDRFEECALLDYPEYPNIGDHCIWLGTIFYLTDVLQAKVKYAANINNFSDSNLQQLSRNTPILLQGGGNLGDLWPQHQIFREYIVSKYKSNPIVILPQSIFFKKNDNLTRAAKVFNSHPNLILFIRDNYSYEIAIKSFDKCKVLKAPDMIFEMAGMPYLSYKINKSSPILYLSRQDQEINKNCELAKNVLDNLVVQDWVSLNWLYRGISKNLDKSYWKIPGIVGLFREGWQKGLSNPPEWIFRQQWQKFHPYSKKFNSLYNPSMHRNSWEFMSSGVYQLKDYSLVITNRLHAHLLCTLMNIPHIFLPNAYHKNLSFYETWTYQIHFSKFINDASYLESNIQELKELF